MGIVQNLFRKSPGASKAYVGYQNWKNKRAEGKPAREKARKKSYEAKVSGMKNRNKLLRLRNEGLVLRKKQLRNTLGFFGKPKASRRPGPRRSRNNVILVQSQPSYGYERRRSPRQPREPRSEGRMWFDN